MDSNEPIDDSEMNLFDEGDIVINSELDADCYSKKPAGYELTDTKRFKTPSGVQKTATIDRQHLQMGNEIIVDDLIQDGEDVVVESSMNYEPSTSSINEEDSRQPQPLRRMVIRIGKKTLRFKVINANEAPESHEVYESSWLTDPEPVTEPKALAGLYHCANCKTYFGNKEVWQRHITEIHGDPRPFRCFNCGMRFSSKSSMTLHLRDHALLSPVYSCKFCSRLFNKIENRNLHQKMHVVRHTCAHCNRFFRTEQLLNNHIKLQHNFDSHGTARGRAARFRCTYCRKTFHFKRDMVIHERIHTGERPFTCGYCGKGFAQSQSLIIHTRTHTNDLPYKCDICDKKFRESSSLRKHELARHVGQPVTRLPFQSNRMPAVSMNPLGKTLRFTRKPEKPLLPADAQHTLYPSI
ncbi:unnamed protein product [Caenorhabditis bovis]|uniref:C2H2-type domain-containing protein n=1 Tax=Caenorhabditis bovis TaxID=2654633 RepID=A0A8S1EWC8_9PELO|nr:unnamed protein product [Caenorhabditis bovis]